MARRYFEILNKGDLDAFDAIVAPDVVFRNPPAVVRGIDAFRKVVASLRAAFPDLHFTLEDEFGEANKVATRWVMRGTQGARKMDVSGMDIFLIADGKIKEIWVNMDSLAQARQDWCLARDADCSHRDESHERWTRLCFLCPLCSLWCMCVAFLWPAQPARFDSRSGARA